MDLQGQLSGTLNFSPFQTGVGMSRQDLCREPSTLVANDRQKLYHQMALTAA